MGPKRKTASTRTAASNRTSARLAAEQRQYALTLHGIGYYVQEANKRISRLIAYHAHRLGLTSSQWLFLRRLFEEDGITQAELSNRMGLMTATTAVAIKELENRGWVERRPDRADGRKYGVFLTHKARQREQQLLEIGLAVHKAVNGEMSDAQWQAIRDGLEVVCENLAAELVDKKLPRNGA